MRMGNSAGSPSKQGEDGFLGSSILDKVCGNVNDADDGRQDENIAPSKKSLPVRMWETADAMCISSPINTSRSRDGSFFSETNNSLAEPREKINPSSALFARALVSEVTDNPYTMTPAAMAEREKRLIKAQEAAKKVQNDKQAPQGGPKPVGAPGMIGQPSLMGSLKHALGQSSSDDANEGSGPAVSSNTPLSNLPPNALARSGPPPAPPPPLGKYAVTIGLSLSRRNSTVGHPDTVTRQTAFDFNELQDRQYKYVSSTDASGWLAGGGERGGPPSANAPSIGYTGSEEMMRPEGAASGSHKVAAPDTVHIPIIHINAASPGAVDAIVSALARGEVFIPHMAIQPEMLSVSGVSPPDLQVRFGCERSEDLPPDQWNNWCLEFMHNQLYEYFQNMGAQWMNRPFSITLAHKVRWKTIKHMNKYFAHAESVVESWREKGPQYLDPQVSYIEGGASAEEVARPHGIYLLRNGVPTNYFAPNFDPPYTTKMTKSLLENVLDKSWDKKRREWTSAPIPRLITPSVLVGAMCGCAEAPTGFMANEVTNAALPYSPPTEEYKKSLRDEYKNLRIAEDSDQSFQRNHHEEEKKADSKEDCSPRESNAMQSPMESETGASTTPKHRHGVPSNRRYGPSPSPENFRAGAGREEVPDPSEAGMATSVATTVQHMNASPTTRLEREAVRRKEVERIRREKEERDAADGWLKEALEEGSDDERSHDDGLNLKTGKLSRYMAAQRSSSGKEPGSLKKGNVKHITDDTAAAPGSKYLTTSEHPDMHRTDSGTLSLDYSLDSSLMEDGSSAMYRATSADGSADRKATAANNYSGGDDPTVAESYSESLASEPVPSDEELFKIGWAKALDPGTGSYYYFTLDRSKTVWENPLNPQSVYSAVSETLQSI